MTTIKYMLNLFVHHLRRSILLWAKYPHSNHIFSSVDVKDLIMVLQVISMFKTLNKFQVLWLKVVSKGSNHNLGSF